MNAKRSDFISKFHLFLFWNAVHRICPKWIFELLIHRWRLWTLLNHIGWLVFLELFQKSNYNQHPFWVSSTPLLLFLNNIIIDLINTKFLGNWWTKAVQQRSQFLYGWYGVKCYIVLAQKEFMTDFPLQMSWSQKPHSILTQHANKVVYDSPGI